MLDFEGPIQGRETFRPPDGSGAAGHKERIERRYSVRRPLLLKSVRLHRHGDIAVGGETDLVSLDIGHQAHVDEMVV